MCSMVPEIEEPDLWTEPVTITAISFGTLAGGFELLPGRVVNVPPQVGGFVLVLSANPLKEAGAAPPLSVFCFHHRAPHQVTFVPVRELPSPITNDPDLRKVGGV